MSQEAQLTTDRTNDNTNRLTYNEIYRGSFSITASAQATGYIGSTSVDITFLNTNRFIPVIDIYVDDSGGGTTSYSHVPFTRVNTSGNVSRTAYYSVSQGSAKGGGFKLSFACTLYDLSSGITKTFYYRVLTAEAGPAVSGTWT